MLKAIPHKTVISGKSNKKYRPGKPWWSEKLTDLWSNVCVKERAWTKCIEKAEKVRLKSAYISARKVFDTEVQKCKRTYWYGLQSELLNECEVDQTSFWKSIGKIGVNGLSKTIPIEIVKQDGSTSNSILEVLERWKHDFSKLFNCSNVDTTDNLNVATESNEVPSHTSFNESISILEVKKAVESAKIGKACGFDGIPVEVLKNDSTVIFLHTLFNICFSSGNVPSIWGKCIINPIPKASTNDPRDPLSYRGISLASSMYKMYCYILNERLSKWAEDNDNIVDEQNGFRRKRSTIDHISSLTNIIDTRKKLRKATFCAFIDFRKAYDSINRSKLWNRLAEIGVTGKLFTSIKALYSNVSSCVRVNDNMTDWFNVNCGLRQGYILYHQFFNLYINDLALYRKSFDTGITCDNELVSKLFIICR